MMENLTKLSKYEKLVLLSLFDDGRKTDTQIARETGVSSPSTNRIRRELEREGVILKYLPVLDLDKFEPNLFAVFLFQWKGDKERTRQMVRKLEKDPKVTFFATGEGSGFTVILLLGFSDLSEAHRYLNEFREEYGACLGDITSFFIPGDGILKQDYTDFLKEKIEKMDEKEGGVKPIHEKN